jgi:PetN
VGITSADVLYSNSMLPPPDVPNGDRLPQAALVAGVSALSVTLAPAAMAAQEAMMVAEVMQRQLLAPHCALLHVQLKPSLIHLSCGSRLCCGSAQGEAPIVQVAWAALCVSFSASLAFVVWGRSGL